MGRSVAPGCRGAMIHVAGLAIDPRERGQSLLLERARLQVLGVGAAVLDQAPGVEMNDARDRRVEEVEVVADHDHRAAVLAQKVHQPRLGLAVEVVGRLVEEE